MTPDPARLCLFGSCLGDYGKLWNFELEVVEWSKKSLMVYTGRSLEVRNAKSYSDCGSPEQGDLEGNNVYD